MVLFTSSGPVEFLALGHFDLLVVLVKMCITAAPAGTKPATFQSQIKHSIYSRPLSGFTFTPLIRLYNKVLLGANAEFEQLDSCGQIS